MKTQDLQKQERKVQTTFDPTVPILLEFAQSDLERSGRYSDCQNCVVASTLHRMGHKTVYVGPGDVDIWIGNRQFTYLSDEIDSDHLLCNGKYRTDLVGRQIILYPA